jgi:mannose-1-phosphate guanylyltransferase/mannose-6-phosphate isomerase
MPADHMIDRPDALLACLPEATRQAQRGAIVTIGIPPRRAETGYGYIQVANTWHHNQTQTTALPVLRFIEKPERSLARYYVRSGEYLWNSGMFVGAAGSLLRMLHMHAPEICQQAWEQGEHLDHYHSPAESPYQTIPALPFDTAVMEQARHGVVFATECQWEDMGSWRRLARYHVSTLMHPVSGLWKGAGIISQ